MFACRILHRGGETFFQENVHSVVFPSLKGPYELFQSHAPMVLALKPGLVVLKKFEEKHLFLVLSGFFLYENNNLSVLVTDEATQLSEDTPEAHERGYRKIFGENHKKDFYDDH